MEEGLQARTPDAEERRSEGSTLYIQCPYTAQTDYQQKKAWCRVKDDECKPLVETTNPTPHPYTNKATKGNVTIADDCLYESVSITMTNLQAEDSGTYSCAHLSNGNSIGSNNCVRYCKAKSSNPFWQLPTTKLDRTERTESPKNDSEDLQYVTLNHKFQLSPEAPLYCNVEPSQAHRKPNDENVEYAVVALKQLPTNEKG
ncbi:polymeric immunoglobulin receptor-like [Limosa lapponica baueri]|nr:polymeric immunoglobulin receptor-like [Limosa lapponica baueri]